MVNLSKGQQVALVLALTFALFFMQMAPAFADSIDTGLNNILKLISKVIAIALIVAGVISVFRGQVMAAVGMIFVGALLIAVAADPGVLKGIGDAVFSLFKG